MGRQPTQYYKHNRFQMLHLLSKSALNVLRLHTGLGYNLNNEPGKAAIHHQTIFSIVRRATVHTRVKLRNSRDRYLLQF